MCNKNNTKTISKKGEVILNTKTTTTTTTTTTKKYRLFLTIMTSVDIINGSRMIELLTQYKSVTVLKKTTHDDYTDRHTDTRASKQAVANCHSDIN